MFSCPDELQLNVIILMVLVDIGCCPTGCYSFYVLCLYLFFCVCDCAVNTQKWLQTVGSDSSVLGFLCSLHFPFSINIMIYFKPVFLCYRTLPCAWKAEPNTHPSDTHVARDDVPSTFKPHRKSRVGDTTALGSYGLQSFIAAPPLEHWLHI